MVINPATTIKLHYYGRIEEQILRDNIISAPADCWRMLLLNQIVKKERRKGKDKEKELDVCHAEF